MIKVTIDYQYTSEVGRTTNPMRAEIQVTDPERAFDAASNMVEMFDDLGYHVTHIDISEEVIVSEG